VLKADLERQALLHEAETAHDPTASPTFKPGSWTSTRIPPLPAPPRSSAASDFRPPIRPDPVRSFPVAGDARRARADHVRGTRFLLLDDATN